MSKCMRWCVDHHAFASPQEKASLQADWMCLQLQALGQVVHRAVAVLKAPMDSSNRKAKQEDASQCKLEMFRSIED